MAAYVIADIDVTDPVAYEGYKRCASESIAAHGGRYLARGGNADALEGTWSPKRVVIVEFPTMSNLRQWYDCDEYRAARELRQRSAVSKIVVVEGL